MILFTVVGVQITTPRLLTLAQSLRYIPEEISVERSKVRVYIRLCMIELKVERITDRENSSKAGGTTWTIRFLPSPSNRVSRGQTTVVLPAPMIICFTAD